jgi:flagellar FliJ protein
MNKVPKFRLQKVLEVREIVEKEKQKELSVSKRKLHSVEDELHDLKQKLDKCTREMNGIAKARVRQIKEQHDYLNTLTQSIEAKCRDVTVVMQDVEIRRLDLLQASRDKKALLNLKDKKEAERKQEELRREQAGLDEIVQNKRNKNHNL